MDYLSDYALENLTVQELSAYFKLLKMHKAEILNQAQLYVETVKATKKELRWRLSYLEDEMILAQLEREDLDNIAFNNTLTSVN